MLEIAGLSKVYEDGTVGVDGLDLTIPAAEIFVLLGANGAGKTSTMMLILGFTEPTAGTVLIRGIDVQKDPLAAKKHVAYVSENVTLYGNFTARQNLEFFTRLSGRKDVSDDEYMAAFRRVGLAENAYRRRVRGFSKGMRQRLGIAIAILMSSHDIFRARAIADRVGIVAHGRLLEVIPKDALAHTDLEKVYLEFMEKVEAGATSAKVD